MKNTDRIEILEKQVKDLEELEELVEENKKLKDAIKIAQELIDKYEEQVTDYRRALEIAQNLVKLHKTLRLNMRNKS
jgi:uncharacterized protein YeeX (DUF496 family)